MKKILLPFVLALFVTNYSAAQNNVSKNVIKHLGDDVTKAGLKGLIKSAEREAFEQAARNSTLRSPSRAFNSAERITGYWETPTFQLKTFNYFSQNTSGKIGLRRAILTNTNQKNWQRLSTNSGRNSELFQKRFSITTHSTLPQYKPGSVLPVKKMNVDYMRRLTAAQQKQLGRKIPPAVVNRLPPGKDANHTFSDKENKFTDNPVSRNVVTSLANDPASYVGIDVKGKLYYARKLADGRQYYIYTRKGIIKGGGINPRPRDIFKEQNLKY